MHNFNKVGYLLVADHRDVIRAHALGKFPDLLKASPHSASMLAYLDQTASRNTAPNQNYAREIMEPRGRPARACRLVAPPSTAPRRR